MITLNGAKITPTIFPDGTSQVWKVEKLDSDINQIVWYFENERELIDLCSLVGLLPKDSYRSLKMPYLPYARQDKEVSNSSTFNLSVFANIINTLKFNVVYAVDVHNPDVTKKLIHNFVNIKADDIIVQIDLEFKPDYIAYPDSGASERYKQVHFAKEDTIIGWKWRDQMTGCIEKYATFDGEMAELKHLRYGTEKILIVDDICDGGATFVAMARELRKLPGPDFKIALYVTHGIFSKGREVLLEQGIDKIYTTNSLLKNTKDMKGVYEV